MATRSAAVPIEVRQVGLNSDARSQDDLKKKASTVPITTGRSSTEGANGTTVARSSLPNRLWWGKRPFSICQAAGKLGERKTMKLALTNRNVSAQPTPSGSRRFDFFQAWFTASAAPCMRPKRMYVHPGPCHRPAMPMASSVATIEVRSVAFPIERTMGM